MNQLSNWKIPDLIPNEYLDRLLYWRDQLSKGCWEVGDITNQLFTLGCANQIDMQHRKLFEAVGLVIGKSARSVRFYAAVAAFFPKAIRQEFDLLPFSHFAFAKRYPDKIIDKDKPGWRSILEMSVDYAAAHHLPPSLERLENLWNETLGLASQKVNPPPLPQPVPASVFISPPPMAQAILADLAAGEDPLEESEVLGYAQLLVGNIQSQLESLHGIINRLNGHYPALTQDLAQASVLLDRSLGIIEKILITGVYNDTGDTDSAQFFAEVGDSSGASPYVWSGPQ